LTSCRRVLYIVGLNFLEVDRIIGSFSIMRYLQDNFGVSQFLRVPRSMMFIIEYALGRRFFCAVMRITTSLLIFNNGTAAVTSALQL
jgi:hypothetical protein